MSLHITNAETCRLAEELTELTSESKTRAVTVALRQRLERERNRRDTVAELHDIGQRCAALAEPGPSAIELGAFLYEERGLPEGRLCGLFPRPIHAKNVERVPRNRCNRHRL